MRIFPQLKNPKNYLNLKIDPSSVTNVSFPIELNSINIFSIISNLQGMKDQIKISFVGDIVADSIKFPLNLEYGI